ncbi:MAG: serine/threonine-protein kinase, partial [Candidatus Brocadiia bacterium]|nr:serine/threonine-protein kinase [Candidatus Brocadiia bacterium]
MNPRLEILVGMQAGDEHEIPPHETAGPVVLGRGVGGGFVQVRDLKSRNGTHVNGRHIREKTELHHGDKGRAGGVELKVKFTQEAPERKPGTAATTALAATKTPHRPAHMSEKISFPGFVLEGPIGEGATTCTYRVHKTDAEAPLALKFVVPDVLISPEERARFLRGARHAAELDHRHLVRVLEVGTHEEIPYMVMEYVGGDILERGLAEAGRPLKVASATSMGLQILSALHYVYERQLVLRSIRPDNVLVVPGSGVRLTDYDLLKVLPGEEEKEVTRLPEDDVFISPEFAPPEMITRPFLADQRADVFGAAACLY